MNILHMKYAVEVEKAGSITQAADNLYMAQPNLSKAIKELEETLAISLFERTPRGMIPTPKGVEFLTHAKNILAEVEMMKSLRRTEKADLQSFSLSMPRGSYIAEGFTQFVSQLDLTKDMNIRIKETNSIQTIHNVADNRFRIGIIRYQTMNETYFLDYLREKGLKHELVWAFQYVVLMSKDSPIAAKENIEKKDLRGQIEIIHGDNSIPYLAVEEANHIPEITREKKIYVYERSTQFDLLTQIPDTYMWVSPIPESVLKKHRLVQRTYASAKVDMKDVLIYCNQYKLSGLDRLFIDCLFAARNQVAFR